MSKRKPLYKDFRKIAADLIAKPAFIGGAFLNYRLNWTKADSLKLDILCEANSDVEASAIALGRPPECVAHRARDTKLVLPKQWSQLIRPKRAIRIELPPTMEYPFVRTARAEHDIILAINGMVPRHGLPDGIRADICQEILLAIMEGRVTLEALRTKQASPSYYIRKFYKENYEDSGRAMSFDSGGSVAPAQFLATWHDQVLSYRLTRNEIGSFLSQEEAEELLDE